jgi:predicted RNA-binding Zn-ribbon protein involved in translation (DUF1610 family)
MYPVAPTAKDCPVNDFHAFQPLFDTLKWLLPPVLGIWLLVKLLKTATFKGWFGERLVRFFAHYCLDRRVYRRLHNVTLDSPDGTTQIDHVFLSPYGVFVLETKNMRGWIFGGEHQAHWTQQLYRQRFKFQNPVMQNYKHLKALEVALGIGPEHLHSVIAFVGGTTFKTQMPANVTQGMRFIRYIKSFRDAVFNDEEVKAMLQELQTGRRAPTLATGREHVRRLKLRDDPTALRQCPRCGEALVVRRFKSGTNVGQPYWGCSAFPKCRTRQPMT